MTRSGAGVQTSARVRQPTKELLFLLITNYYAYHKQGYNPGQEKRVRRCPLLTVTVADTLISRENVLASLAWLKQIDLAGH